jgi:hypothetical protein
LKAKGKKKKKKPTAPMVATQKQTAFIPEDNIVKGGQGVQAIDTNRGTESDRPQGIGSFQHSPQNDHATMSNS